MNNKNSENKDLSSYDLEDNFSNTEEELNSLYELDHDQEEIEQVESVLEYDLNFDFVNNLKTSINLSTIDVSKYSSDYKKLANISHFKGTKKSTLPQTVRTGLLYEEIQSIKRDSFKITLKKDVIFKYSFFYYYEKNIKNIADFRFVEGEILSIYKHKNYKPNIDGKDNIIILLKEKAEKMIPVLKALYLSEFIELCEKTNEFVDCILKTKYIDSIDILGSVYRKNDEIVYFDTVYGDIVYGKIYFIKESQVSGTQIYIKEEDDELHVFTTEQLLNRIYLKTGENIPFLENDFLKVGKQLLIYDQNNLESPYANKQIWYIFSVLGGDKEKVIIYFDDGFFYNLSELKENYRIKKSEIDINDFKVYKGNTYLIDIKSKPEKIIISEIFSKFNHNNDLKESLECQFENGNLIYLNPQDFYLKNKSAKNYLDEKFKKGKKNSLFYTPIIDITNLSRNKTIKTIYGNFNYRLSNKSSNPSTTSLFLKNDKEKLSFHIVDCYISKNSEKINQRFNHFISDEDNFISSNFYKDFYKSVSKYLGHKVYSNGFFIKNNYIYLFSKNENPVFIVDSKKEIVFSNLTESNNKYFYYEIPLQKQQLLFFCSRGLKKTLSSGFWVGLGLENILNQIIDLDINYISYILKLMDSFNSIISENIIDANFTYENKLRPAEIALNFINNIIQAFYKSKVLDLTDNFSYFYNFLENYIELEKNNNKLDKKFFRDSILQNEVVKPIFLEIEKSNEKIKKDFVNEKIGYFKEIANKYKYDPEILDVVNNEINLQKEHCRKILSIAKKITEKILYILSKNISAYVLFRLGKIIDQQVQSDYLFNASNLNDQLNKIIKSNSFELIRKDLNKFLKPEQISQKRSIDHKKYTNAQIELKNIIPKDYDISMGIFKIERDNFSKLKIYSEID